MPDTLASFRGPVSCRRGAAPLGLTLIGETSEHPGERTELAFSAAAPADFPEALEGAVIERVGTHQYRIASAPREALNKAWKARFQVNCVSTRARAAAPIVSRSRS